MAIFLCAIESVRYCREYGYDCAARDLLKKLSKQNGLKNLGTVVGDSGKVICHLKIRKMWG